MNRPSWLLTGCFHCLSQLFIQIFIDCILFTIKFDSRKIIRISDAIQHFANNGGGAKKATKCERWGGGGPNWGNSLYKHMYEVPRPKGGVMIPCGSNAPFPLWCRNTMQLWWRSLIHLITLSINIKLLKWKCYGQLPIYHLHIIWSVRSDLLQGDKFIYGQCLTLP